jgi:hypothetical protein
MSGSSKNNQNIVTPWWIDCDTKVDLVTSAMLSNNLPEASFFRNVVSYPRTNIERKTINVENERNIENTHNIEDLVDGDYAEHYNQTEKNKAPQQKITYPKIGDIVANGFKVIVDLNEVSCDEDSEEVNNQKAQEIEELNKRNIGSYAEYTPEQLAIRIRIGKRMTKAIYDDAFATRGKDMADCYVTHPPYMFYTEQSSIDENKATPVRRLYGICMHEKGEYAAFAVTGLTLFNNVIVGGISLSNMIPLEQWSNIQLSYIKSGLVKTPGLFLDPLGFVAFINSSE